MPTIESLDGMPDWVLLVLFLLFGAGGPMLFSKVASKLPGVLGAGRRWLDSRSSIAKAEAVESQSYKRQAREIERLSEQYDRIAENYRELTTRVEHLEDQLSVANKRFSAAVDHIRQLRLLWGRSGPAEKLPPVPENISEFV